MLELALSKYEQWLKNEDDKFQSTLYEKIVRELMTLGESREATGTGVQELPATRVQVELFTELCTVVV